MNPEKKTALLNLKVRPSFKALVETLAVEENRSITSFLEHLVFEHQKRKLRKRPTPPSG